MGFEPRNDCEQVVASKDRRIEELEAARSELQVWVVEEATKAANAGALAVADAFNRMEMRLSPHDLTREI